MKGSEKLRPPHPFPGTEAPGTVAPRGAYAPPPHAHSQRLPRCRPALSTPSSGPPPNGGWTLDVTSGVPKSFSERTNTPFSPLCRLPGEFCPSENELFPVVSPDLSAHFCLSSTPPKSELLLGPGLLRKTKPLAPPGSLALCASGYGEWVGLGWAPGALWGELSF